MNAIILLDYIHLDNALFMKTLSEQISKMNQEHKLFIIHGASPYKERLKAAGIDNKQALIRSSKELNRRIIALLADDGVNAIGIHAFQRELFNRSSDDNRSLDVNKKSLSGMNLSPVIVCSNVLSTENEADQNLLSITRMAHALMDQTEYLTTYFFPASEMLSIELPETLDETAKLNLLPEEMLEFECDARMINVRDLSKMDDFSVSLPIS